MYLLYIHAAYGIFKNFIIITLIYIIIIQKV